MGENGEFIAYSMAGYFVKELFDSKSIKPFLYYTRIVVNRFTQCWGCHNCQFNRYCINKLDLNAATTQAVVTTVSEKPQKYAEVKFKFILV